MKKFRFEYLWLSLILLFGGFLRVYGLGKSSLWVDEATSSVVALNILAKGVPIFDSGLFYGRAYLFHYFQAFFLLFGHTEFLARFASVIFGVGIILLGFFVGREYSKSGGLIASLFMAVFYLEVFYSRQARFYQLFQLLFFLSIYLLYKSKDNRKFLIWGIVSLFVCVNVQIAGLVLVPFFVLHILAFSAKKDRWISAIPLVAFLNKFFVVGGLSGDSVDVAVNYFSRYVSYAVNMVYMFVLFLPGVAWSYFEKKRLTVLMVLPTVILLIGVFGLQTFALRYAYFAVFPLVLYFSLLFSYLYEKYGKVILILIFVLLVVPSNIFYPYNSVNILKPVDYSFYDLSAPVTDYKALPEDLKVELKREDVVLVSYFSSDVEWNLRKPDFVLPFSMDGRGEDQVSYENSEGVLVDRYSGARILVSVPEGDYYVLVDSFSGSKLKSGQIEFLGDLTEGCDEVYEARDLRVYYCG